MESMANKNQEQQQQQENTQQPGTLAQKMTTMKQPNLDNRVKTEDVTNTKGLTFKSFGLSEEVQFVSGIFFVSQIRKSRADFESPE